MQNADLKLIAHGLTYDELKKVNMPKEKLTKEEQLEVLQEKLSRLCRKVAHDLTNTNLLLTFVLEDLNKQSQPEQAIKNFEQCIKEINKVVDLITDNYKKDSSIYF